MKIQRGALTRKGLALLLVVAVAIAALAGWRLNSNSVVKPPEEIEDYLFWQVKELTDFKLTGADNKALTLNDLKGKWSFIFFGYTQCPDVCPMTLSVLGKAFKQLEGNPAVFQDIQGIFISVDPDRDTPELLKEYVSYFSHKLIGVTGNKDQLDAFSRQMSALYTIHAQDPKQPEIGYQVTHNSTIFLIDPQGRLYGRFPPPQLPKEIADIFVKVRAFHIERSKSKWQIF